VAGATEGSYVFGVIVEGISVNMMPFNFRIPAFFAWTNHAKFSTRPIVSSTKRCGITLPIGIA
jgi:hypothetical protein